MAFSISALQAHSLWLSQMTFFDFFQEYSFFRVSNSLNPDQAQRLVRSDLGPNCLQSLSADDTSRQKVRPQ